jgi:hypothetical protein
VDSLQQGDDSVRYKERHGEAQIEELRSSKPLIPRPRCGSNDLIPHPMPLKSHKAIKAMHSEHKYIISIIFIKNCYYQWLSWVSWVFIGVSACSWDRLKGNAPHTGMG